MKQLQILILSTHAGPCQAQSFLKKHLEKNADYKKKHPSDNTRSSLARPSHPQTGPRDHRAWTTTVIPLLTISWGGAGSHVPPDLKESHQPQKPLHTFLHSAGKENRARAPPSPPKETSSTLQPGTWPTLMLGNPKTHCFPVRCLTKPAAHWQKYLSALRQTPTQCAWFNQESPNSRVFPAEREDIVQTHDRKLSSYQKMAVCHISSPHLQSSH